MCVTSLPTALLRVSCSRSTVAPCSTQMMAMLPKPSASFQWREVVKSHKWRVDVYASDGYFILEGQETAFKLIATGFCTFVHCAEMATAQDCRAAASSLGLKFNQPPQPTQFRHH